MFIKSAQIEGDYLVHTVEINGKDERFFTHKAFADGDFLGGLKRAVAYVKEKRSKQMGTVG